MACSVECEEKIILRLSNNTTSDLHEKMLDLVVREGFGNNQKIIEFVSDCDQDQDAGGIIYADVSKSFGNDPEQLGLFIPLLNEAIIALCEERKNEDLLKVCNDFRNKVESYYHSISN